MALLRIDEKTLMQKIKVFIIGHEKPNWATRLSIMAGFAVWLYFLLYLAIIFLTILFVDTLENPELIRDTFGKIGGKYNFNIEYQSLNWQAIDVIYYHALISICLLAISLVGLIYIYRRKKIGYILYLVGNTATMAFTFFFLGLAYVADQFSAFDKWFFLGVTIYFLVAMFLLKSNKAINEKITEPRQS